MAAQYFVVTDRQGNITYKPAAEVVTRNAEAFLRFDTPLYEAVLAQADTANQAQRYVDLLRNRRAA